MTPLELDRTPKSGEEHQNHLALESGDQHQDQLRKKLDYLKKNFEKCYY